MSMLNSTTSPSLVCPEIDASDLKAARDFLLSFRDESQAPSQAPSRPRPFPRHGERKAPAVSNGIARARFRSTSSSPPKTSV